MVIAVRRRFDLLAATTVVAVATGFFLWESAVTAHAVEARFAGRAMNLSVEVAGASLVIVNKDSAAFRDCYATVDREYRADRGFLLPTVNEPGDAAAHLQLAEFSSGDRLLDWRRHPPARLEIWCGQYAGFGGERLGRPEASDPDAQKWTDRPARWVGRL